MSTVLYVGMDVHSTSYSLATFALGDREARTRNSVLMTVQRNTEELAEHYRRLGLDVTWELNPGNHFKDAALRSAKGIKAILE